MPLFVGSENSSSGPHSHVTSTSATGPSPATLGCLLIKTPKQLRRRCTLARSQPPKPQNGSVPDSVQNESLGLALAGLWWGQQKDCWWINTSLPSAFPRNLGTGLCVPERAIISLPSPTSGKQGTSFPGSTYPHHISQSPCQLPGCSSLHTFLQLAATCSL